MGEQIDYLEEINVQEGANINKFLEHETQKIQCPTNLEKGKVTLFSDYALGEMIPQFLFNLHDSYFFTRLRVFKNPTVKLIIYSKYTSLICHITEPCAKQSLK